MGRGCGGVVWLGAVCGLGGGGCFLMEKSRASGDIGVVNGEWLGSDRGLECVGGGSVGGWGGDWG